MKTKPGQAQEYEGSFKSRSGSAQNAQTSNSRRNYSSASTKVVSGSKYNLKPVQLSSMRMGETSSASTPTSHSQLQHTTSDSNTSQWRSGSNSSAAPREQAWRNSDNRSANGQNNRSWSSVAGHATTSVPSYSGAPLGEANFPPLASDGTPVSNEPQLKPQGAGFWIQRHAPEDASQLTVQPFRNSVNSESDGHADDERTMRPSYVSSQGYAQPSTHVPIGSQPTMSALKESQVAPHQPPQAAYRGSPPYSVFRPQFPPSQGTYAYVPPFAVQPPGTANWQPNESSHHTLENCTEKIVQPEHSSSKPKQETSKPWSNANYREVDYSAQVNFSDDEESVDRGESSSAFSERRKENEINVPYDHRSNPVESNFDNLPSAPSLVSQGVKKPDHPTVSLPLPYSASADDDDGDEEIMMAVERARRHRLEQQQRQQKSVPVKESETVSSKKGDNSEKKQQSRSTGRRQVREEMPVYSSEFEAKQHSTKSSLINKHRSTGENSVHMRSNKAHENEDGKSERSRANFNQHQKGQRNPASYSTRGYPRNPQENYELDGNEEGVKTSYNKNVPTIKRSSNSSINTNREKQVAGLNKSQSSSVKPKQNSQPASFSEAAKSLNADSEKVEGKRGNISRNRVEQDGVAPDFNPKSKALNQSPRRREKGGPSSTTASVRGRGGRGMLNNRPETSRGGSSRSSRGDHHSFPIRRTGRDYNECSNLPNNEMGESGKFSRHYTPSGDSGSNPARATSTDVNEQWETASETSIDRNNQKSSKSQDHSKQYADGKTNEWTKSSQHRPAKINERANSETNESYRKGSKASSNSRGSRKGNSSGSPAPKRQLAATLSTEGSSSQTRSGSNSSPGRPPRAKPNPLKDIDLNNIAGVVNIDTIAPSATSNVDDFVLGDDGETVLIDNADGFQQVVSKKERRQSKKQPPVVTESTAGKGSVVAQIATAPTRGAHSAAGNRRAQQQRGGKSANARKAQQQHEKQLESESGNFDNFQKWDPSSGGPLPPPLLGPSPNRHQHQSSSSAIQHSPPVTENSKGPFTESVAPPIHTEDDNEDEILGPKSQQLLCNITELTHLSAVADQAAEEQDVVSKSNTSGIVGEAVWSSGPDSFGTGQPNSTGKVKSEQQNQESQAAQSQVNFPFNFPDTASGQSGQSQGDFAAKYWSSLPVSAAAFVPSTSASVSIANAEEFSKHPYNSLQVSLADTSSSGSQALSPGRHPERLAVSTTQQSSNTQVGPNSSTVRPVAVTSSDLYFPQGQVSVQQPAHMTANAPRYAFQGQFVAPAQQQPQQGQQLVLNTQNPQQSSTMQIDEKGFQPQNQQQFTATIAAGLPIHLGAPPQAQQPLHPSISAGPQPSFPPMESASVIPTGFPLYSDQFFTAPHFSGVAPIPGFQSASTSSGQPNQGSQMFQPTAPQTAAQPPPSSQGPQSLSMLFNGDFYQAAGSGPFAAPSGQNSSKSAISPAGQASSMMQNAVASNNGKPGQQQFPIGPANSLPLQPFQIGHMSTLDPSAASPGAHPPGAYFAAHPSFPGVLTAQVPPPAQPQSGQPQHQQQGGPPTPQPQPFFQIPQPGMPGAPQQPNAALFQAPRMQSTQPANSVAPGASLMSPTPNLQSLMASLQANFKSINVGNSNTNSVARSSHSPSTQFDRSKVIGNQHGSVMGMPQQQQQAGNSRQHQYDVARKMVADWNTNPAIVAATTNNPMRLPPGRQNSPPISSSITAQQIQSIINQVSKPQQQQSSQSQSQQPIGSSIVGMKNTAPGPQQQLSIHMQNSGQFGASQPPSNMRFLGQGAISSAPGAQRPSLNLAPGSNGPSQQQSPSLPRFLATGAIGQAQTQQQQQPPNFLSGVGVAGKSQIVQQLQQGPNSGMQALIRLQQHQRQQNQQPGNAGCNSADQSRSNVRQVESNRSLSPKHLQSAAKPSPVGSIGGGGGFGQRFQHGQIGGKVGALGKPQGEQHDSQHNFRRSDRSGQPPMRNSDDVRVAEHGGSRRIGGTPEVPSSQADSLNLPAPPPFPGDDFARFTLNRRDGSSAEPVDRPQIDHPSEDNSQLQGVMPAVPPIPHDLRLLMSGMWPQSQPGQPPTSAPIPPLLTDQYHHMKPVGSNRSQRGSTGTSRRGSSTAHQRTAHSQNPIACNSNPTEESRSSRASPEDLQHTESNGNISQNSPTESSTVSKSNVVSATEISNEVSSEAAVAPVEASAE